MIFPLSGDMAYQLFMQTNDRLPLNTWVAQYGNGELCVQAGYVIAVVMAYKRMLENCHDGRYNGVIRDLNGNVLFDGGSK